MSWLKKIFAKYRIIICQLNGKDIFIPEYRFKIFSGKWYRLMPGYMNWKTTLQDAEQYIAEDKRDRKKAKEHAKTIKFKYY